MRSLLLAALAAAFLVLPATAAADDAPWTTTVIEGAGATVVQPAAISDSGWVVGKAVFPDSDPYSRPFAWKDGVMHELPVPADARQAEATDVNESGVVVGFWDSKTVGGRYTSATWTGLKAKELPCCTPDVPADRQPGPGSQAYGINDAGQVAGLVYSRETRQGEPPDYFNNAGRFSGGAWTAVQGADPNGVRARGIGFDVNKTGTLLMRGIFGPDRAALATGAGPGVRYEIWPGFQGLNDAGHIAGSAPFGAPTGRIPLLWDGQGYVQLDGPGALQAGNANAVNTSDWAVGFHGQADGTTGGDAMVWRPNDPPLQLGSVSQLYFDVRMATDVNRDGATVGWGRDVDTRELIGYRMVPNGVGYQVTGHVSDADGNGVPDVHVKVVDGAGKEMPSAYYSGQTNGEGGYLWILPKGTYRLSAGGRPVTAGSECSTVVGTACEVTLDRNRRVDFGAPWKDPSGNGTGGGGSGGGGTGGSDGSGGGGTGGGGSSGGGAGGGATGGGAAGAEGAPSGGVAGQAGSGGADTTGPVVTVPRAGTTLRPSAKGVVTVALGRALEPVTGTLRLETAAKVTVARRARLVLGRAAVSAKAGSTLRVRVQLSSRARKLLRRSTVKARLVVTLRDGRGNATTRTAVVRLRR